MEMFEDISEMLRNISEMIQRALLKSYSTAEPFMLNSIDGLQIALLSKT